MHTKTKSAVAVISAALCVAPAFGWGADGHRMVASVGMAKLPADMPSFLLTPAARQEVTYLAPEADRQKSAGEARDKDMDPGHFVDAGDDQKVFAGPALAALPPTREAYDTALREHRHTQYDAGWLPYAMAEGYQLLVKDFAYWRAAAAGEKFAKTEVLRRGYANQRAVREMITLHDIGYWSHYVGDASQPLHVTVHFNGWGDYPNPGRYTQAHVHGPWESGFVRSFVSEIEVAKYVPPSSSCTKPALTCVGDFLTASSAQVEPFYRLEQRGAFLTGSADGVAFTATQIARGAGELRDLISAAWHESATAKISWPEVSVTDIEAGKAEAPRE